MKSIICALLLAIFVNTTNAADATLSATGILKVIEVDGSFSFAIKIKNYERLIYIKPNRNIVNKCLKLDGKKVVIEAIYIPGAYCLPLTSIIEQNK